MSNRHCWTSRDEFLTAVGTVNAEVTVRKHYVRYATKFTMIADRISSLARAADTRQLRTLTDDGTHVITIRGFYNGRGRTL